MKRFYENELHKIFLNIFPLGQKLRKQDVPSYGLISYTSLSRLGIQLSELNLKFERQYWQNHPIECLECRSHIILQNNELLPNYRVRKFCNQSCSAIFHNRSRIKIPSTECTWCKKLHTNDQYCSKLCSDNDLYCNIFLDWYLERKKNFKNSVIRKFLTDIHGYQCDNYRLDKKHFCNPAHFNKLTLEVDHIDGHHENNTPSNVRLLCPTCHMATETYGGANRGNGRAYRRIRYAEGKSY